MRFTLIAAVFLIVGTTVAQAGTTSDISGCPVNINVNQQGLGKTVWTISEEDAHKNGHLTTDSGGTGVHVYLHSKTELEIKEVLLRVFYPEFGLHYLPVSPGSPVAHSEPNALRELKKTFHLTADGGASLHLAGNLLVNQAGGVTRVALMSVVYANGYTWLTSSSRSCSVEPDHFMLVQAK
jgi:hypothetical protein